VANVSQGTTVTWNGVTLGEVVNVSVDGVTAETVDVTPRTSTSRQKVFAVADTDYGTVTATVRGTAGMASTNVGLTGTLSITGPSVSWSFTGAIFEKLGWNASVGELQTYNVTFKVGA
jgi:hypothetical protein